MGLFNRMNKPVFLKEGSDTLGYLNKLKELRLKASGQLEEQIEREINLATYGDLGEKNIAFELKNSGIPMYILHDIYIEAGDLSAQIDYVVITKKLIFIIECKNLVGNIDIDSSGNFIRKYKFRNKSIREGIYSPITQNERHLHVIRQKRRNSINLIIERIVFDKFFNSYYKTIVVLANPKTILNNRYAKKEVKDNVIRADQLINHIKKLNNKFNESNLSDSKMFKIANRFLEMHTPNKTYYAKKYEELLTNTKNDENQKKIVAKKKSKATKDNITQKTEILINKLKAYRLEKSREENIKAYYIFSNKQMNELIEKIPLTKSELLEIYGFGEKKIEKYGEDLLKIFKRFKKL